MPQEFEPPSGKVKEAIDEEFGSLDDFIAKFNPTTAAVQACDAPMTVFCELQIAHRVSSTHAPHHVAAHV
jgi:hypothetical protein